MGDADSFRMRMEGVRYRYPRAGSDALSGIDLEFEQGRMYAVLGRNGSGKSTLARCLNGLLVPTVGRVTVGGLDSADGASGLEIRRNVAMVFQNPDAQMIASSVEEEVAFGPENLGLEPALIRGRVDRAMDLVGIRELARRQPRKLSQGQKQLVAVAGALAMEPRFIVSDESTSMLDHDARERVLELFGRLRDDGLGIVHVTHFLEEALLADTVVILEDGVVADEGAPADVLSSPDEVRGLGLRPLEVTVVIRELATLGHRVPAGVLDIEELLSWLNA
jgi:energy-coupling factor transport system ATP-binding protein